MEGVDGVHHGHRVERKRGDEEENAGLDHGVFAVWPVTASWSASTPAPFICEIVTLINV